MAFIGAVDQGTTSSRFLIFDENGRMVTFHQIEITPFNPAPGRVEHDPYEILRTVNECMQEAFKRFEIMGHSVSNVKAIGITNQRETAVMWDKETGKPLHNALVWSDVRTDDLVRELSQRADASKVAERCGLSIGSYFSAVKVKWLIENVETVKEAVKDGRAAFGTVDSWLIYQLTDRQTHCTDVTNACRTLLLNLETLEWDDELLAFFDIPASILPRLVSSSEVYGTVADGPFCGVPIAGCMGDQQAALLGQKCFEQGEAKCTFGTGAFMLFNTGPQPIRSSHGLITTVAFQLGRERQAQYALEGSIAVAGSGLRWLRDNMRLIETIEQVNDLAERVSDTKGVYFVPAFSGLFAPYWRDDARGTMVGLTSYTTKHHLARATLESMAYQSRAILDSMNVDAGVPLKVLKVDGGVSNSDVAMKIQADAIGIEVHRPAMRESTALGAAMAAGLAVGVWKDVDALRHVNKDDLSVFVPNLDPVVRDERYATWKKAVEASYDWTTDLSQR